ncbi:hypothetical protein [Phormidium sp. CCY1219]|uniref:hypothetical protein n=1 Tax=Phormidium sp. CCY1219 TaxID=2886104 RepID=UPI002D1F88C6|nr:hypothetical protein [Phormidium sp. CCY1219]MEB3829376.1 hypothetical protein [Phormidium sp. CCY1219]
MVKPGFFGKKAQGMRSTNPAIGQSRSLAQKRELAKKPTGKKLEEIAPSHASSLEANPCTKNPPLTLPANQNCIARENG